MNDLVEWIEISTPKKVDRQKLLAYLYENKIPASRLYFILLTCSRLVRQDYLKEFEDFDIYEEVVK